MAEPIRPSPEAGIGNTWRSQVQVPADAKSVWVRLIFNGTGTAAFDDIDFRLTPLQ